MVNIPKIETNEGYFFFIWHIDNNVYDIFGHITAESMTKYANYVFSMDSLQVVVLLVVNKDNLKIRYKKTRGLLAKQAAVSGTRCMLYPPKKALGWCACTHAHIPKSYIVKQLLMVNFS